MDFFGRREGRVGFCRQELTDLHQHIPLVDLLIQTHQPPGACLKNSICPDEETYVRFKNRQFIFQQQSDGPRLLFALHPQRNIISIFSRKKKEKERGGGLCSPCPGGWYICSGSDPATPCHMQNNQFREELCISRFRTGPLITY